MSWIFLAIGGQFLNAVVAILDKFIVSDERALPRPFVYAFFSCIVTSFWAVIYLLGLLPGLAELGVPQFSNIEAPTIEVVGMSFLAAYTFFMALVSMYNALKLADASDVMPVIGAVSAMSTFGLSWVLFSTPLTPNFIWGIALLVCGTLLVSQVRMTGSIVLYTIHSGLFFALHYAAMKGLFLATSFDDGFFWSRVALVIFTLSLLLIPVYWKKVAKHTKATTLTTSILVLSTKVMAGVAAFLLLKATDHGDVAAVQALDGLKYVFIIIISILIGRFIPASAGENEHDIKTIIRKVAYVVVISIGLIFLFAA